MLRRALLILTVAIAGSAHAAIDMDAAAQVYEAAAVREQVRPTLKSMPNRMRDMFMAGSKTALTPAQSKAIEEAAEHGFTISVFEPAALSALAESLDAANTKKALTFLKSDVGARMVRADQALALLDEPTIDKIMAGQLKAPSTHARDQLFDKLERAARSTESTVQIFSSMSDAVALGAAIGAGSDPIAAEQRASKADDGRVEMENSMRESLRRYMAYGYRDLSDADLKSILAYLESKPGVRYVSAYIASMAAGFDAMGKRCGEQIGGSLREFAQTQESSGQPLKTVPVPVPSVPTPAAPTPARPAVPAAPKPQNPP